MCLTNQKTQLDQFVDKSNLNILVKSPSIRYLKFNKLLLDPFKLKKKTNFCMRSKERKRQIKIKEKKNLKHRTLVRKTY